MSIITDLLNSKMQQGRATQLRDEDLSQEDINKVMSQVINNAIVAQTGGTKKMQQRAIEEMQQVRQDLVTKNINMQGNAQNKYVGKLTGLIDNLQQVEKQNEKTGSVVQNLSANLPSADTLISGLMTANPIMGYGVKMARDLFAGVKGSRDRQKMEAQRRLEILEETKRQLEEEFETKEEEGEDNKKIEDNLDLYGDVLKSINEEIKALIAVIDFSGSDSLKIINENIEKSTNLQEDQLEIEKETLEKQELDDIRLRREEDNMLESGVDTGKNGGSGFTFFGSLPKKLQSILTGIGSFFKKIALGGVGIAALAGTATMGIITKVISGISSVFTGIFKMGKHIPKLLKLGGRLLIVGNFILALWDFVDGFLNAADFLGKDEKELNIGDKIVSGFLKINDSILELVDWVAGWFNIEIFGEEGRENVKNALYNIYEMAVKWTTDTIENIVNFFKDFSITEKMGELKDWAGNLMSNIYNKIKDKITQMIDDTWNFIKNAPGNLVEAGKKKVGETIDSAKETGREISNFLGFGDDEETQVVPIRGIMSGEMGGTNNIFSQSMRSAEELDYRNKKGAGAGVVANNNNSIVNNNSTNILNGEKSSSNNEPTLKNARFMKNIRFIDN